MEIFFNNKTFLFIKSLRIEKYLDSGNFEHADMAYCMELQCFKKYARSLLPIQNQIEM